MYNNLIIKFSSIMIDCIDQHELAKFYARLIDKVLLKAITSRFCSLVGGI